MNSFMNRLKVFVVGCMVCCMVFVGTSTVALAEGTGVDLSELEPDYSSLGPIALAIGGGLMAMWGIRKVVKLVNRS